MGEYADYAIQSLIRNGIPFSRKPRPDIKDVPEDAEWVEAEVVSLMTAREFGSIHLVTPTSDPKYYYVKKFKTKGPNKGQPNGYGTIETRAIKILEGDN